MKSDLREIRRFNVFRGCTFPRHGLERYLWMVLIDGIHQMAGGPRM